MKTQFLLTALLIALGRPSPAADPTQPKTTLTIVGEDFHINGQPTYAGREWQGHRVEGLLLHSRMVQATFVDLNPETAKRWAYPDIDKWDAECNMREFIAALPEWKRHGLLAVTVNFQGGSPEGYSSKQTWLTSGFKPDGSLRPAFADRLRRVLDAADELGRVVILGYFYFDRDQQLRDEPAVLRATDEATRWLLDGAQELTRLPGLGSEFLPLSGNRGWLLPARGVAADEANALGGSGDVVLPKRLVFDGNVALEALPL